MRKASVAPELAHTATSQVACRHTKQSTPSHNDCPLLYGDGLENTANASAAEYCSVCVEELGNYMRSKASQPTKAPNIPLLDTFKSVLGGSSLVSVRWVTPLGRWPRHYVITGDADWVLLLTGKNVVSVDSLPLFVL
jgi:hypothetical protein